MILNPRTYDYCIVGGGIIGLAVARSIKLRFPSAAVCLIEKEHDVAQHASGRNSGVLHAGFYYTADSLKAKFTRDGNRMMKEFCRGQGIPVAETGKLVVASTPEELEGLRELKRRGDINGVALHWVDSADLQKYDPRAKSYQQALYSPNTASVNPLQVCKEMKCVVEDLGVDIELGTKFIRYTERTVETDKGKMKCEYLINAAGLYADKIAHQLGFGQKYTILPFKGIYLHYCKNDNDIQTNIYPVPNLKNPFLGVHFTKTVDGHVKIGPTAIPAFWRENYKGFANFKFSEFMTVLSYEARLFLLNKFRFRSLAFEEMKKYNKKNFIELSKVLVHDIDETGFGEYLRPGIRAQLLDKKTLSLVQDFVVEGDKRSFHVLNAVSPAFTCSLPFAEYIVDKICEVRQINVEKESALHANH